MRVTPGVVGLHQSISDWQLTNTSSGERPIWRTVINQRPRAEPVTRTGSLQGGSIAAVTTPKILRCRSRRVHVENHNSYLAERDSASLIRPDISGNIEWSMKGTRSARWPVKPRHGVFCCNRNRNFANRSQATSEQPIKSHSQSVWSWLYTFDWRCRALRWFSWMSEMSEQWSFCGGGSQALAPTMATASNKMKLSMEKCHVTRSKQFRRGHLLAPVVLHWNR